MIELRNLSVTKSGRTVCQLPALSVAIGERVQIVGPNASGKTTLLRALAGLEPHVQGRCAIAAPVRERTYVHQDPLLFRGTALDNVRYGLAARGVKRGLQRSHAMEALVRLNAGDLAKRRGDQLSGGERRRVALARAFVLNPRLLLLDEPLADLDAAGANAVMGAIQSLPDATVLVAAPLPLPEDFGFRTVPL